MNWIFYVGGGYLFYIMVAVAILRLIGKQDAPVGNAVSVAVIMVWIWICWRFL